MVLLMLSNRLTRVLYVCAAVTAISAPLAAQRAVLPAGTVILVRTNTALESGTATVGSTFETVVADTIAADNYTVIPSGSRIRGVITMARPATRQQSGVIELDFDRLVMPDGRTYTMNGKLTSTVAEERRQIDSTQTRVVLVGGRGGIGAAIAGTGSDKTGILSALGSLLSEGQNVSVPAGTTLAVQLEQALALNRRGYARGNGASTIYTAADRITAAQQALTRLNYYRGAINGQLTGPTQRALAQFQIDKGITATGNLDVATAQALGIYVAAGEVSDANTLTITEAASVRRTSQQIALQQRTDLRISTTGLLDPRVAYTTGDLETWFALSAFADNASLYEALVRASGNTNGTTVAGKALVAAARRVDAALNAGSGSNAVRNAWISLRAQLKVLDSSY